MASQSTALWRLMFGRWEIEGDTANPGRPVTDRSQGQPQSIESTRFSATAGPFVCLRYADEKDVGAALGHYRVRTQSGLKALLLLEIRQDQP